jgi:hypothetical protein
VGPLLVLLYVCDAPLLVLEASTCPCVLMVSSLHFSVCCCVAVSRQVDICTMLLTALLCWACKLSHDMSKRLVSTKHLFTPTHASVSGCLCVSDAHVSVYMFVCLVVFVSSSLLVACVRFSNAAVSSCLRVQFYTWYISLLLFMLHLSL